MVSFAEVVVLVEGPTEQRFVAEAIGIPGMRSACPLFNGWLTQLEALAGRENGEA